MLKKQVEKLSNEMSSRKNILIYVFYFDFNFTITSTIACMGTHGFAWIFLFESQPKYFNIAINISMVLLSS